MEKEAIFGAPSAHNASQLFVQKQLFTSRFLVGRGEPIRYDNGARNESNFKRTDWGQYSSHTGSTCREVRVAAIYS